MDDMETFDLNVGDDDAIDYNIETKSEPAMPDPMEFDVDEPAVRPRTRSTKKEADVSYDDTDEQTRHQNLLLHEQLGALGVFGIIQVRSVVHNVGGVLCVCACLFFCWGWAAQLSGQSIHSGWIVQYSKDDFQTSHFTGSAPYALGRFGTKLAGRMFRGF